MMLTVQFAAGVGTTAMTWVAARARAAMERVNFMMEVCLVRRGCGEGKRCKGFEGCKAGVCCVGSGGLKKKKKEKKKEKMETSGWVYMRAVSSNPCLGDSWT